VPSGANAPTQGAYDTVFGGGVPSTSAIAFNTDGSPFSTTPVVGYTGDTSDPGYNPANYTYNFAPVNYLQLPLERRQIAAFGYFGLTENSEVYARMMYTNYQSDVELAATPISGGVGSTMPATNQFIPAGLATILASRPDPTADFTFTKRTLDVGPRSGKNGWDVMQALVGVKGDFEMLNNPWHWDVFGSWGTTQRTELQGGNVSRSRLNAAYYGDDTNSALAAAGCTGANGLNPFGIGTMSAACAGAVGIQATNVTELEQTNVVASVTGGLFELPAGTVQTAVGVEYRENVGTFRPDEFLASGDVVGFNAAQPVDGTTDVSEVFAEFSIPLLSEMAFANYLGLDAAYRFSDYNVAGGVNTYMVGLEYAPIESLKLRGSFNRATRAANIGELYTPASEGFPQYSDPCWNNSPERTGADAAQVNALCAAQGAFPNFPQGNAQVRAITGGNPDLEPENADTYTMGLVWQPTFGDNDLRLAIDWFRYEITETIGSVGASSIVSRCYNQQDANPTYDINNVWCGLFTRSASGEATDVRANNQNLGQRNVDGIDVQADFGVEMGPGDLTASLAATYLLKWELQEDPAAPLARVEGTISTAVATSFPELKARLSLGYAWSDFNVRWTMNYIDSMRVVNNNAARTEVTVGLAPNVSTYVYHRLTGAWAITDDINIMLGIDNLTDKQPPIYTADNGAGIQSNTDPSTYDVLGQRFFLSADFRFGGN
jgi:outer membrane receptor protein involved in Fe transport